MMKATILLVPLFFVMISAHPSFQPIHQTPGFPTDIRPRPTPTFPRPPSGPIYRFRREARPQDRGSVNLEVRKPIDGSHQPPSIDLNYNHHLMNDGRGHLDAYGGANYEMHRLRPQAGFELERNYNNGFLRGSGGVSPGLRGRIDPQIRFETGFRF